MYIPPRCRFDTYPVGNIYPVVNPVGNVISQVISRGYTPRTTTIPWVTSVENTYPVCTISRGLHYPRDIRVLSTVYISRGLYPLGVFSSTDTVRIPPKKWKFVNRGVKFLQSRWFRKMPRDIPALKFFVFKIYLKTKILNPSVRSHCNTILVRSLGPKV